MPRWFLLVLVVMVGCKRDEAEPEEAAPPPPPAAQEPKRTAAADRDLRVLLAELAAQHACAKVRGYMIALAPPGSKVATGSMVIDRCEGSQRGSHLRLQIGGLGWQWVQQRKEKAGADFALRQYAAFSFGAALEGAVDIAYHPGKKVVTLWFTPTQTPQVDVDPRGDLDVDEEGLWSSVVGGLASAFLSSPEEQAAGELEKKGGQEMRTMLAQGFAVTADLCTGVVTADLKRPPPGEMIPKRRPTDTPRRGRLEPGGLILVGPHAPGKRMSLTVEIDGSGVVAVDLLCQAEAERLARQFADTGSISAPDRPLLSRVITGRAQLRLKSARCPVVVATRGLGVPADVIYSWERIPADSGKPLLRCAEPAHP
jgi:hypothetical protein